MLEEEIIELDFCGKNTSVFSVCVLCELDKIKKYIGPLILNAPIQPRIEQDKIFIGGYK